jgi:hypothetical protein
MPELSMEQMAERTVQLVKQRIRDKLPAGGEYDQILGHLAYGLLGRMPELVLLQQYDEAGALIAIIVEAALAAGYNTCRTEQLKSMHWLVAEEARP